MPNILQSQGSALVLGVNAFAPLVEKMHEEFKAGGFSDWPTVILSQTMQATLVSMFKLLPPADSRELLIDTRSLATLTRNVVDTYDVIDMMVSPVSEQEHHLNRQILGYYISSRIAQVQKSIDAPEAQKFFPFAKKQYWSSIQNSSLIDPRKKDKLRSGESVFYKSRAERARAAFGDQSDFVMGVLTDLSTYVHSIPPALWMHHSSEAYADTEETRDKIGLWLRIVNFVYAQSIRIILRVTKYDLSNDLKIFLDHHKRLFSD